MSHEEKVYTMNDMKEAYSRLIERYSELDLKLLKGHYPEQISSLENTIKQITETISKPFTARSYPTRAMVMRYIRETLPVIRDLLHIQDQIYYVNMWHEQIDDEKKKEREIGRGKKRRKVRLHKDKKGLFIKIINKNKNIQKVYGTRDKLVEYLIKHILQKKKRKPTAGTKKITKEIQQLKEDEKALNQLEKKEIDLRWYLEDQKKALENKEQTKELVEKKKQLEEDIKQLERKQEENPLAKLRKIIYARYGDKVGAWKKLAQDAKVTGKTEDEVLSEIWKRHKPDIIKDLTNKEAFQSIISLTGTIPPPTIPPKSTFTPKPTFSPKPSPIHTPKPTFTLKPSPIHTPTPKPISTPKSTPTTKIPAIKKKISTMTLRKAKNALLDYNSVNNWEDLKVPSGVNSGSEKDVLNWYWNNDKHQAISKVGYPTSLTNIETRDNIFGSGKNSEVSSEVLGLYDDQIDSIMKRYPEYLGTVASDEIDSLLPKIHPGSKGGFIMNLDKASQKGSHWVSCYFDPASIEYFDSFAEPASKDFMRRIKDIADKVQPHGYLKFKENKIIQQDDKTNNCGYFAMKFLIDRFRGIPFSECTGYDDHIKGEKDIEKFKKKLGVEPFKYISGGSSRTDYSPAMKRFLQEHGNDIITSLSVIRQPINSRLTKLADWLSLGKTAQNRTEQGLDYYFHLAILVNGKWKLHKTYHIEQTSFNPQPETQTSSVRTPYNTTINQLLEKGKEAHIAKGKDWFDYDITNNNCQDWIDSVLTGNHINTPALKSFVLQDTEKALKGAEHIGPIFKGVTDFANKLDSFFNGE